MPKEITVPRLGWSMEEGTFVEWLKQPGDTVNAGDLLFALESDKVTMEVEALDSGALHLDSAAPQPGTTVRVGQVIGFLLDPAEPLPAPRSRIPVTPRARRLAAQLNVDLSRLQGTGAGGRIREHDVRAAAPPAPAAGPVSSLRRTIAHRMLESRDRTAPVTLTRRIDASRLTALRNRWKLALHPAPPPAFHDFAAKVVALALGRHPLLASRWEDDRIVLPSALDIGIAVDTEHGLLVPVLRNVDQVPLPDLARTSRNLVEAARSRKLQPADLQGGVFTITNLGSFGVEAFTPILNYPETAVLGMGAIRWEPAVRHDGQIVAREQMVLSLTFDHRVVDGAPAARFLQTVAELLEEPPPALHCP